MIKPPTRVEGIASQSWTKEILEGRFKSPIFSGQVGQRKLLARRQSASYRTLGMLKVCPCPLGNLEGRIKRILSASLGVGCVRASILFTACAGLQSRHLISKKSSLASKGTILSSGKLKLGPSDYASRFNFSLSSIGIYRRSLYWGTPASALLRYKCYYRHRR